MIQHELFLCVVRGTVGAFKHWNFVTEDVLVKVRAEQWLQSEHGVTHGTFIYQPEKHEKWSNIKKQPLQNVKDSNQLFSNSTNDTLCFLSGCQICLIKVTMWNKQAKVKPPHLKYTDEKVTMILHTKRYRTWILHLGGNTNLIMWRLWNSFRLQQLDVSTYLGSPAFTPGCCVYAWECVPGADLKAMGQRGHL